MDNKPPLPDNTPLPYGLEDEIDLIEYLVALFRAKYWIMLIALVFAGAGYGLGNMMTPRYESFVHLALREPDEPGGVSPDNRRAPEVMTLMEYGFVMEAANDNYRHIITARMRSRLFTNRFIERQGVLPQLYPEQWDADKNSWKDGFKPDLNEAFKVFHQDIRSITHNPENDLMAVHIRWKDPVVAARWANAYVAEFNDYMREQAIGESLRKIEFLNRELQKSTTVEMERSMYRMIEAETAIQMLANARDNYVLEVLDSAVPAERPFKPSLKRMVVFGFFAGFGLAFAGVIGGVIVGKIRRAMQAYKARTADHD